MFLKTKYRYAHLYSFIYDEIFELREMCTKNPLNGRLDKIDYTVYGSEGFLNQDWTETQRLIELKNIYNEVLSECEPKIKK